jgi:hypothetical protein
MRRVQTRTSLAQEWERVPISTEVVFETELGDIRVGWDRATGRVKIYVFAAGDGIDAVDIRPVGSNVVSIGLTGERMA